MKEQRVTQFSLVLWRSLQTPPARQWTRSGSAPRRIDQMALVLAFGLSALAVLSGVILSALVTYRAADRIARARENGTFDLLAVTPGGGFGASWAIFAGVLHYDFTLPILNRMRWAALGAVLILLGITLLSLHPAGADLIDSEEWPWLVFLGFLLPMMIFDHLYAIVSGGLLGVLIPTYVQAEARPVAIFAACLLPLTAYLVAALVGGVVLPGIFGSLGGSGWLADLLRALLALAAFILTHEAAALLLYRTAQTRLTGLENASLPAPDAASRP